MSTVIIQKPDMDTCLTALLLNITKDDKIICRRANAMSEELADKSIICIEAGGSGQIELMNFDHHDTSYYLPPACVQAASFMGIQNNFILRLVEYVSFIDEAKPLPVTIEFPSLSNVFSGMLLTTHEPLKQFWAGIAVLDTTIQQQIDPFQQMPSLPQWTAYIQAKLENQRAIQQALQSAQFFTSKKGLTIGYCETQVIGGIFALYEKGCDVVVMYNPTFGNPPIHKFTIASNNISIYHLKEIFNKLEDGWGGRDTIIGSPRNGTKLSQLTVLEIVMENL